MGTRQVVRLLTVLLSVVAAALLAGTTALAAPIAVQQPVDPVALQAKLDALAQRNPSAVPRSVGGWYVDPATKQFVIETTNAPQATTFATQAGAAPSGIRIVGVEETPKPFYNLVGGQAIYASNGGRCSIGFSARGGGVTYVITAGHCTELGGTWSGYNRVAIGPVARTNFPTDDFGTIRVNNTSTWVPTSQIQGGPSVLGSTEAAVGTQVCRSGSTTGYRCGTIQAKNATVNYGGGDIVYGLVRTNACAEPGDSGGSFIAPGSRQAQGMTSGGSGNCAQGGTTFYQPVNEVLSRYGLTLVTG